MKKNCNIISFFDLVALILRHTVEQREDKKVKTWLNMLNVETKYQISYIGTECRQTVYLFKILFNLKCKCNVNGKLLFVTINDFKRKKNNLVTYSSFAFSYFCTLRITTFGLLLHIYLIKNKRWRVHFCNFMQLLY